MPYTYRYSSLFTRFIGFLFCITAPLLAAEENPYQLIWHSPAKNVNETVPLGNGETGLNAWITSDGTLHFYVSRIDSIDENGQLLKVGLLSFSPDQGNDTISDNSFKQILDLKTGTLTAEYGNVNYKLWVDANQNLVVVEMETTEPSTISVKNEGWRNERAKRNHLETSDLYQTANGYESESFRNAYKIPKWDDLETIIEPDTVINAGITDHQIGWFHRNKHSKPYQLTALIQGMEDFNRTDPLLHRTFGAIVQCIPIGSVTDVTKIDDKTLQSKGTKHVFQVAVNVKVPSSEQEWINETQAMFKIDTPLQQRYEETAKWWNDFWNRSWIHFTKSEEPMAVKIETLIPQNDHSLKIGVDQHGGSKFSGQIENIEVQEHPDRLIYSAAVTPTHIGNYMRIFDKITPGNSDGFLIDITPQGQLRVIIGTYTGTSEKVFTANEKTAVSVIIKSDGIETLIDGKTIAMNDTLPDDSFNGLSDQFILTRAYALQRFVSACAGRGTLPIKFNGSVFTVPAKDVEGDADYRRWGPGYWFQNTRLPYYSMPAAGDFDTMQPFFKMYIDELLPVMKYRTKKYFGHGGAYYPECIYFWGDVFLESYGWEMWNARPKNSLWGPLQKSGYHRWEWVGGLEIACLALEYYEFTGDKKFLIEKALPLAKELLLFFDEHHQKDADGKMVLYPSQALETWWDSTNAMPEVAGLHCLIEILERLDNAAANQLVAEYKPKLPAIPLLEKEGKTMLAAAKEFKDKRNIENPELYAVFPFRLFAYNRPNVEFAVGAMNARLDKGNMGWRQDDIFYAYLGMREEAISYLMKRAKSKHTESRFPAWWGPNYDWIPDQDHGSILMKGTQSLVMQTDGQRIDLFPAMPKGWNCDFKLYAPYETVVEGTLKEGKIVNLKVEPKEREVNVRLSL